MLILRSLVIPSVAILGLSESASAQERFFTSGNRAGADGARQNVQLQTIQNTAIGQEACANLGMLYAPAHPQRDGSNCIAPFRVEADGSATFTNRINAATGNVTAPAIVFGTTGDGLYSATNDQVNVSVNGVERIRVGTDGLSVIGNVSTTGSYFLGGVNFSGVPQCQADHKLQWTTGSGWSCTADVTQTGAGTPIGTLVNGALCRSNGSQIVCDAAAPGAHAYGSLLSCPADQKLAWSGSAWTCYSDQGITTASLPTCTGSNKALQWDGSSWACATISGGGGGGGGGTCVGKVISGTVNATVDGWGGATTPVGYSGSAPTMNAGQSTSMSISFGGHPLTGMGTSISVTCGADGKHSTSGFSGSACRQTDDSGHCYQNAYWSAGGASW